MGLAAPDIVAGYAVLKNGINSLACSCRSTCGLDDVAIPSGVARIANGEDLVHAGFQRNAAGPALGDLRVGVFKIRVERKAHAKILADHQVTFRSGTPISVREGVHLEAKR